MSRTCSSQVNINILRRWIESCNVYVLLDWYQPEHVPRTYASDTRQTLLDLLEVLLRLSWVPDSMKQVIGFTLREQIKVTAHPSLHSPYKIRKHTNQEINQIHHVRNVTPGRLVCQPRPQDKRRSR